MTLIAPENRHDIGNNTGKGAAALSTKQLNFTGLSKGRPQRECETFLLFIPYKWGLAIHGHAAQHLRGQANRRGHCRGP